MTSSNINSDIENLLRKGTEEEIPADAHARLRQQMVDFREQMEPTVTPQEKNIFRTIRERFHMRRFKWAVVTAATILVVVLISFIPRGRGMSQVYAAAARQTRMARAMTCVFFNNTTEPGEPTEKGSFMFKEPNSFRMTMDTGDVMVNVEGKMLLMLKETKQVIAMDFVGMPRDRAQLDFINKMRTLPERAEEYLGERKVDGRTVRVFRVVEDGLNASVWVDAETSELVRIEENPVDKDDIPTVMTDFRFDMELDDSLFILTPPEDFTSLVDIQADMSNPNEDDLIRYLRYSAETLGGGFFPSGFTVEDLMNQKPTAVLKKDPESVRAKAELERLDAIQKDKFEKVEEARKNRTDIKAALTEWKKASDDWIEAMNKSVEASNDRIEAMEKRVFGISPGEEMPTLEEAMQNSMQNAMKNVRGLVFVQEMKPENDWHYNGKGVALGDAKTPICWYKATGGNSETYRVIYGDLSIRNLPPKDIPTP